MPETASTSAGTPVPIDLGFGASGNPTSAAPVGAPIGGTVSGYPATTVTFTPTTGFSGAASFQFTLANAFGTSNTATATITVSRPGPPILSVTPTYKPVGAAAGTASFSVSNIGGGTMSYAASVTIGSAWLTITSGGSGGNSGTINVHYDANSGALRSGTIQVSAVGASGSPVTVSVTQAASTPMIAVHLVDPFLLGANLSSINLSPLYSAQNWAAVQAKGLVADGVSAAIAVVQTNDCASNIALTTTNGTKLLVWNPGFLTTAPVATAGVQSLTITAAYLGRPIGGFCFAAVLVQGPIGGPAPSFTAPIFVTSRQGSQTSQVVQADLVPPPVILVHGIWDDRHGLGGNDGAGTTNGLAHYLKTTAPWASWESRLPGWVSVLCYSKYFRFDAPIDPLIIAPIAPLGASESCEQTSKDAITSRIYGLLAYLDSQKIVGSRVDLVAHSMGGLAARYYASRSWYRSLRNRNQGQFHEIITLDTPELGTELAPFLDNHSSCTRQVSDPLNLNYIVWGVFCHSVSSSTTVRQCFENSGHPLAAPGYDLNLGAVYSLYPNGPALQNPRLPPPNIPNADWRAIGANAPFNSALEADLNGLIGAIYPQDSPKCRAPGTAPLIFKILGDTNEDAVVVVPSQLAGAQANHFHTFQGLSHTEGVAIPGFGLSKDNVLDCQDLNQLVACWLSRSGDSACLAGIPDPPACVTPVRVAKAAPANKIAGLPASFTPVAANTAAPNNNAVPMPHIVTKRPHSVDRLTLRVPTGLELGKPFDLAVNAGTGGLPELHVVQSSETGGQVEVPVSISRIEGQTVHLNVTPKFHGATRLQVTAAYPDNGVATKEVAANVNLPALVFGSFRADELPVARIPLVVPGSPPIDSHNPTLRLQPWGLVASFVGGRFYLPTNIVRFTIDPPSGLSIIKLDANGIIHPLRVGTATVKAQYNGQFPPLTSQVQVNVVNVQQ